VAKKSQTYIMTRKVIASVAVGPHKELLELSFGKLSHYANLYGYEISICDESLDPTRPASWTKILHILNLMPDFDEILWIDSDAIIIDASKDIADEVYQETDIAWVHHSYGGEVHPNAGVMFIRSNSATLQLFEAVNMQTDLTDHPWWDQAAIMRVMGLESKVWPFDLKGPFDHILIKDQMLSTEWNSIRQDPSEKPRIRHFAGEKFWIRKLLTAEYSHPYGSSGQILEELISGPGNIANSHAENQELVSQNQELASENQQLKIQISQVHSSRIWKIIGPYRGISRCISRVFEMRRSK
jgi:hypothetical protein